MSDAMASFHFATLLDRIQDCLDSPGAPKAAHAAKNHLSYSTFQRLRSQAVGVRNHSWTGEPPFGLDVPYRNFRALSNLLRSLKPESYAEFLKPDAVECGLVPSAGPAPQGLYHPVRMQAGLNSSRPDDVGPLTLLEVVWLIASRHHEEEILKQRLTLTQMQGLVQNSFDVRNIHEDACRLLEQIGVEPPKRPKQPTEPTEPKQPTLDGPRLKQLCDIWFDRYVELEIRVDSSREGS
jgi:hypothetical protein